MFAFPSKKVVILAVQHRSLDEALFINLEAASNIQTF
jgi:hypothetical protein